MIKLQRMYKVTYQGLSDGLFNAAISYKKNDHRQDPRTFTKGGGASVIKRASSSPSKASKPSKPSKVKVRRGGALKV